jgi:hypothetical protein
MGTRVTSAGASGAGGHGFDTQPATPFGHAAIWPQRDLDTARSAQRDPDTPRFRRHAFNYSEIAGNSAAVAISNAYYTDNRTAGDAAAKLGFQIDWTQPQISSMNLAGPGAETFIAAGNEISSNRRRDLGR